ncbi:DUF3280 domain-containing protein [Methylobacterium marchantiae]|uniref:DUF3280 domain-containing protein n=1 Tax=Methylobacterium marchantiae TaxID=600331 RepID=A0ABW3X0F0_9HYPH
MTPPTRLPFAHLPRAAALALALAIGLAGPALAGPEKAAVFDFQFAKGAPTPPTDEERARLTRISGQLRDLLEASGRYTIVSTDPVRQKVEKGADLRACNGCAEEYARTLGAEAAITGEVQKVSNLILNINVYVKDLKAGTPEKAYSVDLRGNTDESFDRGIKYLVKNQMLDGTAH